MDVGLVVMASGFSRRFGRNKLLEDVAGVPMIERVLDAIPESGFKTVVVTRYPEIARLARDRGFEAVDNEYPDIRDTIRLGVERLVDLPGICFLVADQPFIKPRTLTLLRSEFISNPSCIVRVTYNGMPGNPAIFPRALYGELLSLSRSQSGADVILRHQDRVRFVQTDEKELWDVDCKDDIDRIRRNGHE